jgi:hypothetical protein
MQHIRRRNPSPLGELPGLPAEVIVEGHAPLRGTVLEVRDGNVVIELGRVVAATVLAAAVTARLIVHAPGVRFEAMTAAAGPARSRAVDLRIGPDIAVRPRIA